MVLQNPNQDILGRETCISSHTPKLSMLFAMREGSLTLWDKVRSPQILEAFRGVLVLRWLLFCPGKGVSTWEAKGNSICKPEQSPLWEQEWVCISRFYVSTKNQLVNSVEIQLTF